MGLQKCSIAEHFLLLQDSGPVPSTYTVTQIAYNSIQFWSGLSSASMGTKHAHNKHANMQHSPKTVYLKKLRANTIAQQVKALAVPAWEPEFGI